MNNIKFNEKYTINKGQEIITFNQGKGNNINGQYGSGTLTGTIDGDVLTATYHNQKNNSAGLIEITFHEKGFNAKWKQGLEPGPMRGKWNGSLDNSPIIDNKEKQDDSKRKVAIYAGQTDEETEEMIAISQAEEKPSIIAIGFFDTHLEGSENEWYGFVGYVITNTCDKVRTESVFFMDELGQTVTAHDMGGEAFTEDDIDLVSEFKKLYPNEWLQIEHLLDEYFYCSDEDQDEETLYLTLKKDIPEEVLMTSVFSGDWLDLEEVKTNNGSSVGLMIEL
jgi:hypothetical protein